MKIMNQYTLHQIKKNKRHSISILVAISIASALLFCLGMFAYSYWQAKIEATTYENGNWHGELYESISGNKFGDIKDNKEVETTMVKGDWMTVQLPSCKLPYLLMRDGDSGFWKEMNLKNTIIKGRAPVKEGEIVVAKQFFLDNPIFQVGDHLTLPVGDRMVGNKKLGTRDYKQPQETFQVRSTKNYTIVGMLDVSATSAYPGYICMGYLAENSISKAEELTVYLRLRHPRKIYQTLPEIAEKAGLKKNGKGQYGINYNTELLKLYGIGENDHLTSQFILILGMGLILLLLVVGTFILIIYNAFSLSANSKVKELSILKSIGATPRQIKYSVLYEGFLLWLIQVPIGILSGFGFTKLLFTQINRILAATVDYRTMKLVFSWRVFVIVLLISLLTVLLSSYIPARKIAKVPAVEGIQNFIRIKRLRDHKFLYRVFGMEGELSGRTFKVNRKSLKTAIVSLSLCITLVISYLSIISIFNYAQATKTEISPYDMSLDLNLIDPPDTEMLQQIRNLPEVKESVVHRQVTMATYVTKEEESKKFADAGGFESVDAKYSVEKVDEKYKVLAPLVGLSEDSFQHYCEQIGTSAKQYHDKKQVKGVLYDITYHENTDTKQISEMPMLQGKENTSMHLQEKVDDSSQENYGCDITVKKVTTKEAGELGLSRYNVAIVVPMEVYQEVISHLSKERALEANKMTIDLKVGEHNSAEVKRKIEKICNHYLGSNDYSIWSQLEQNEDDKIRQNAIAVAVYGIAILFGVIGIFNACSTITNNLLLHKRDYAMLRSIGLTPTGLNKMLLLEGTLFVLSPMIVSLPFVFLVCRFMLKATTISWSEYMKICPFGGIISYLVVMILVIFMAYIGSSKVIKRDNLVESIQNEIV
ncbi:putative ABC transporter integral membrane protein [Lachnospiraceae bacterium KM106-2]|nr:putative ABC transporter integral membrane protein [Lachnospiraceae bacterium KM106-2]